MVITGGQVTMIPVEVLYAAYTQGRFPMCHEDGELYWHDPDPRAVFPLELIRPNARMRRHMRHDRIETTFDRSFENVIRACAARPGTWIDERLIASYTALHGAGHAHSVEAWQAGGLVGGIYGVSIGAAFFGESMFSHVSNAGKVAFHALVDHLRAQGFLLFDTQYINAFTEQLGAVEVPREDYLLMLREAIEAPVVF